LLIQKLEGSVCSNGQKTRITHPTCGLDAMGFFTKLLLSKY